MGSQEQHEWRNDALVLSMPPHVNKQCVRFSVRVWGPGTSLTFRYSDRRCWRIFHQSEKVPYSSSCA